MWEADADSAFGFIKNFVEAEEKQVILHAPLRDFDRKNYQYTTSNMIKEKQELTCANNVKVKVDTQETLSFEFPLKTCRTCPKADMCPLARSKVATLNENHEAARKAINRQRKIEK